MFTVPMTLREGVTRKPFEFYYSHSIHGASVELIRVIHLSTWTPGRIKTKANAPQTASWVRVFGLRGPNVERLLP